MCYARFSLSRVYRVRRVFFAGYSKGTRDDCARHLRVKTHALAGASRRRGVTVCPSLRRAVSREIALDMRLAKTRSANAGQSAARARDGRATRCTARDEKLHETARSDLLLLPPASPVARRGQREPNEPARGTIRQKRKKDSRRETRITCRS